MSTQLAGSTKGTFSLSVSMDGTGTHRWPGQPIRLQRVASADNRVGGLLTGRMHLRVIAPNPQVAPDQAVPPCPGSDFNLIFVQNGRADDIVFRRMASATGLQGSGDRASTEFQVNTFTTYTEARPDLAVHSDGSFVVAWESHDGYYAPHYERDDGVGVFGRRFTNDGAGDADEFHINSFTSGIERDLSIAMTGSGEFVVVWERAESLYGSANSYARLFTMGSGTMTSTTLPNGACGDPNGSGIAATDSLIVLQAAVGQQVALMCPAC